MANTDNPGDIKINGKWYRIDLLSYKAKDIIDFAPRAATPGGSIVMSDLNLYQPLLQTSWNHGFGFLWYSDEAGYMRTDGKVDTRHDGVAMLFTQYNNVTTDVTGWYWGMTRFAGKLYMFGDALAESSNGNSWAAHTFSGIERDAEASASANNVDELTWNHTVTNLGTDRILVVRLGLRAGTTVTVSGITFNGVALTQLATTGTTNKAEIWYLKNPSVGTYEVTVTLSAAANLAAGSTSFLYVDQTTPFDTAVTGSGTGTSSSITVTGATGDLVLDVLEKVGGVGDALIVGTGQTLELLKSTTGTNINQGASSYEASGASVAMTWSWTNSRAWQGIGVNMNSSSAVPTGAVNYAYAAGDYLFYSRDGQRLRKISKAGVDSPAGLDANAKDYLWIIAHKGFIYAGVEGTNRVHYSSLTDLSDLEGTTADVNAIYVGLDNVPTIGAIVYAGNLYVSREDGLWMIGDDNIARKVIDLASEINSGNFGETQRFTGRMGMVVYNGYLIFPIRNHIYQWNGARMSDITPGRVTDDLTFPYKNYARFSCFTVANGFMFCVGVGDANTSAEDNVMLSWDGTAWHKVMDVTTDSDAEYVSFIYFDSYDNRLYHRVELNPNEETRYISFWDASDFPYPYYPTTGTHSLISSKLDMGFRRIVKSMTSMLVEASGIRADTRLDIYYSLDSGNWILWDSITQNGTTELSFPGGERSREFHFMQYRVDFITSNSAYTPILEGITTRFILRPDVHFGFNFNVIAASKIEHGRYVGRSESGADIVKALRSLRDSKSPVEFVDIMGLTQFVYVSSVTEVPRERSGDVVDGQLDIEYVINVNLVIAG